MLELKTCLDQVRAEGPLVLSITNQVTINECANGLLAIGASPVMSDDPADAESLAGLASATVLNIGTISPPRLAVMMAAGRGARQAGRPVVLDPVGVGATSVRRESARQVIAEIRPDIIRGNFSEIKALAGLTNRQKGVDSIENEDVPAVAAVARDLSLELKAVVAVTGSTDVVADGETVHLVGGGSPLLTRITGAGCLLSAMVGAYVGANCGRPAQATLGALSHMALAGERAARETGGRPALGTFRVRLFDHLALIGGDDLASFLKVRGR